MQAYGHDMSIVPMNPEKLALLEQDRHEAGAINAPHRGEGSYDACSCLWGCCQPIAGGEKGGVVSSVLATVKLQC